MDSSLSSCCPSHLYYFPVSYGIEQSIRNATSIHASNTLRVNVMLQSSTGIYYRKTPRNSGNPRRTKLLLDLEVNQFPKKKVTPPCCPPFDEYLIGDETIESTDDHVMHGNVFRTDNGELDEEKQEIEDEDDVEENIVWDSEEIEAISSLFKGRIPQKPGKLHRERPLPLPLPHKIRPVGLPSHKKHVRTPSRDSFSSKVYKNPGFLINLAKEIKTLPPEDVSSVLNKWAPSLRKGSLSLTIKELGHMGLPEKALQIFCWAQNQPHLFPDDRVLASTVEVLAKTRGLKMPFDFENLLSLASQKVYEAAVRGYIQSGSLKLAHKLLCAAKSSKRVLNPSIYAKLLLELGKNPEDHLLALSLLEELGEREDLNLRQQDCTAIMKICNKLGKFETVESLFNWFKANRGDPGVVMYTTMIHGYCLKGCYRQALGVVWEMEASDCLLDLPAYRVVMKLFVALSDLPRTARYFSKLKEAGFSPPFDVYRDVIKVYAVHGRVAKCREVLKEAEMAGFSLDDKTMSLASNSVSTSGPVSTACL